MTYNFLIFEYAYFAGVTEPENIKYIHYEFLNTCFSAMKLFYNLISVTLILYNDICQENVLKY